MWKYFLGIVKNIKINGIDGPGCAGIFMHLNGPGRSGYFRPVKSFIALGPRKLTIYDFNNTCTTVPAGEKLL